MIFSKLNTLLMKLTQRTFFYLAFFVFGLSLFILSSCKEKELQAMQKIIKESQEIELFLIQNTPTNPTEQDTSKVYLCDYEAFEKISISPEQSDSLKTALLDTTNYISDVEKKCMMMPKYAMRMKTKKDTLDIVFSDNPCAKAVAKNSLLKNPKIDKVDEEKKKENMFYVDLTTENTIIKLIQSIIPKKE
jgi:formaldehyde-activating enzyme involved in methanogenesis